MKARGFLPIKEPKYFATFGVIRNFTNSESDISLLC